MRNTRELCWVILLVICLIPLSAAARADTWAAWKTKYAAGSPIFAEQKSRPPYWRLSDENYTDCLHGEVPNWRFERSLTDLGRDAEFSKGVNSNRAYLKALFTDPTAKVREEVLRKNLDALLAEQTDPKTFRIIFTGLQHTIEVFFDHADEKFLYAQIPFNQTTTTGNDDLWKFFETVGASRKLRYGRALSPSRVERVGADSSLMTVTSTPAQLSFLVERQKAPANLLSKEVPNSFTVLIGDHHGVNETKIIEELPNAEEWKASGITTIEIALEAPELKFRPESYTLKEVEAAIGIWLHPKKHYLGLLKTRVPKLEEESKALDPISSPLYQAVLDRAKLYLDGGLNVKFRGIE